MKLRIITTLLLTLLSCSVAFAAPSPVALLESTADRVIKVVEQNQARLKRDPDSAYGLVYPILRPHLDKTGMARSVLGRDVWQKATSSQKARFSDEFTKLVVRTYSSALAEYNNEKVKFFPVRGGYAGKSRVKVKSMVIRQSGPSIPIDYRLILRGNSWKIYDMSVEGVSLLQSFRSQFATELAHSSLEQLIPKLTRHNINKRR